MLKGYMGSFVKYVYRLNFELGTNVISALHRSNRPGNYINVKYYSDSIFYARHGEFIDAMYMYVTNIKCKSSIKKELGKYLVDLPDDYTPALLMAAHFMKLSKFKIDKDIESRMAIKICHAILKQDPYAGTNMAKYYELIWFHYIVCNPKKYGRYTLVFLSAGVSMNYSDNLSISESKIIKCKNKFNVIKYDKGCKPNYFKDICII